MTRLKTLIMVDFGDEKASDIVERELATRFDLHVRTIKAPKPRVRMRGLQVNGEDLLSEVSRLRSKLESDYAIGFVKDDLYVPDLNFVFGLASREGGSAVVSSHRLASPHPGLYRDRLTKEVVHELGHVFGLGHCEGLHCVMHFSNSLEDTDIKNSILCPKCESRLRLSIEG